MMSNLNESPSRRYFVAKNRNGSGVCERIGSKAPVVSVRTIFSNCL
jgi:hypothetical protein